MLGVFDPVQAAAHDTWSPDDVAAGAQNFLLCAEMLCAAVVHMSVFPPDDYLRLQQRRAERRRDVRCA